MSLISQATERIYEKSSPVMSKSDILKNALRSCLYALFSFLRSLSKSKSSSRAPILFDMVDRDHPIMILSLLECAGLVAASFFNLFPHPNNDMEFMLYSTPKSSSSSPLFDIRRYFRKKAPSHDEYSQDPARYSPENISKEFFRSQSRKKSSSSKHNHEYLRFDDDLSSIISIADPEDSMLTVESQIKYNVTDFANKRIGGGVLRHGSVQEEILMITSPDLLVAKLLCTPLEEDSDSLWILGAKPFSNYSGYSKKFRYNGPVHLDPTNTKPILLSSNFSGKSSFSPSFLRYREKDVQILPFSTCAMDAFEFEEDDDCLQSLPGNAVREIVKSLSCFYPASNNAYWRYLFSNYSGPRCLIRTLFPEQLE
ncbi:Poly(ADP-ribose) glycohydrolase like protein, partial [Aduncisulcus paluster]